MTEAPALAVRLDLPLDRFRLAVDFVAERRVTGVFGSSGAGKTSLLRAIAGLQRRSRGRVALGEEVWLDSDRRLDLPPERRGVGYVPQEGLLFPHLDVRGNLLAGSARAHGGGGDPAVTFDLVCRLLELEPLLGRATATLSGGERQRVALGRAICSGPRLLLLDEPLASLDLQLRRKALPLLRRIRNELRIPILIVSHDPLEVQALCDEVLVLRQGRIETRGPVREVLTDPAVLPADSRDGFENVLPCRLVETRGETSLVALDDAGRVRLLTPRVEGRAGEELLVGVPSREIVVSAGEPGGLSARNNLAATVSSLRHYGDLRLLSATLGDRGPDLAAVVTARSCEELGLAPGRAVYLVIKTASCAVYGGA